MPTDVTTDEQRVVELCDQLLAKHDPKTTPPAEFLGAQYDLGLGWLRPHRDSERGLRWIQHLGGGGGYGAVMRLWPDRGRGVVAMANVSFQRFDYETLLKPLAAA